MPTRGIIKLFYEFLCLQIALDNSTITSFNSYLYYTILIRNMIPTSGLRQRYHGNLCILALFNNSYKNDDAYKWQ